MAIEQQSGTVPKHPIQVVARRTGLTPDALRAWEKRYEAVAPVRAAGGRRLYTDDDIRRLLLLRRATEGGRRIGQVAGLDDAELEALVAQDDAAAADAPRARPRAVRSPASAVLEQCVEAVRELDAERLEDLLSRAQVDLAMPALVDEVLAPLADRIGEGWETGELRISHEHLATAIVRAILGVHMRTRASSSSDPLLIATTPAGQVHELGALMASVTATAEGWRVVYLGPDLPAAEIASAAETTGAACIALSLVYPTDDPHLGEELSRLRRLVGEEIPIVVGGRAAPSYGETLSRIGARRIESFSDLRGELRRLRVVSG